jgi:hypothetical protein
VSVEGEQAVATFRELAAEPRVEAVPLSHLSVELGHLYMEDFAAGPRRLAAQFGRVAPWVRTQVEAMRASYPRLRVSSCFLIDDYFTKFSSPAEVVPVLLDAARGAGLEIDYLARESACAEADGIPLGLMVADELIALPPLNTNGSRPPTSASGWLCNGERRPAASAEAMRHSEWQPPIEIGARNHSVFVDVELWNELKGTRKFSCAYLAAIWQLLRLGMVRYEGANVVRPRRLDEFPRQWEDLPPIVQLRPTAAPFCAYHTFSVLPSRFLQVEIAVRVILGQVALQREVIDQVAERAARDGVAVPRDVTERLEYMFFRDREVRSASAG